MCMQQQTDGGGGRLTGAGLKDSPSVIVGVHAATDRQGEGMYQVQA